jgi:hypothetical protein
MRKILLSLVALSLAAGGCGGEDSDESTAQQQGASAPPAQQSPTASNADTRRTDTRQPHRRTQQLSEPAPKRMNTPSRSGQPAIAKEEEEEKTKSQEGPGSGEAATARKAHEGPGTVTDAARPKKDDRR